MDEKKNGYLSVKDIARIKSRHEETIRRWINANKIEVPKFSSKKEGYSIPVESLIQSGILTEEEVERYLRPDSGDIRAEKKNSPLPDWRALMNGHEKAQGEELLNLIAQLNRALRECESRRRRISEQILHLKNQIMDLEFEASSLENEGREITDYTTWLRGKL